MISSVRKINSDTKTDRILNTDFITKIRSGYVEVGEENICLPVYYENYEERIRNFNVQDDDIFICAHPKTGTTWMQEMVWLIANNLDYEGAKQEIVMRSPQLELAALFDFNTLDFMSFAFDNLKSPRCIKSHLHWSLLPEQIRTGTKQPKIIVTLRNAMDTCVSLYYHSQTIDGYKGNFEDFCELFLAGRVPFGPFWKQVFSYWQQKDNPNILFIKYTDMKKDIRLVIKKVSEFLNKPLNEDQIEVLQKHLSFESMKVNPNVNLKDISRMLKDTYNYEENSEFIRAGKVGGYKDEMSPELIKKFWIWTEENLAGTGLVLD